MPNIDQAMQVGGWGVVGRRGEGWGGLVRVGGWVGGVQRVSPEVPQEKHRCYDTVYGVGSVAYIR